MSHHWGTRHVIHPTSVDSWDEFMVKRYWTDLDGPTSWLSWIVIFLMLHNPMNLMSQIHSCRDPREPLHDPLPPLSVSYFSESFGWQKENKSGMCVGWWKGDIGDSTSERDVGYLETDPFAHRCIIVVSCVPDRQSTSPLLDPHSATWRHYSPLLPRAQCAKCEAGLCEWLPDCWDLFEVPHAGDAPDAVIFGANKKWLGLIGQGFMSGHVKWDRKTCVVTSVEPRAVDGRSCWLELVLEHANASDRFLWLVPYKLHHLKRAYAVRLKNDNCFPCSRKSKSMRHCILITYCVLWECQITTRTVSMYSNLQKDKT